MTRLGLVLAVLAAFAAPAWAAESTAVRSERATVTLVSDTDTVAPGQALRLGLRLRLAPGWHTYWQNPGDAGAPAELTLGLPEGARAGSIAWPAPRRLPDGPLMSYGYTDEVLLPVRVTPGAGPLTVEATASWLVCERICVPEEGTFRLDLPQGRPAPSAEAPLFAAAEARLPRPSPFAATVAPDGTLVVSGDGVGPDAVRDAWFMPLAAGVLDQAAPQRVRVGEGRVEVALTPGAGFKPDAPLPGVLVLRDPAGQESALAVEAAPRPGGASGSASGEVPGSASGEVPGSAAAGGLPFGRGVLFAFLGGVLLNLMPCVFPVLAMKAVSIARMSGAARGAVRAHALSYTAGVLATFAALGGALLAVRAAGGAAGWGFQFQSPAFVAGMAWLLFAVGLNLSGVYRMGGALAGAGQGLAGRGGHAGSFFTGLLAVLVATPCTAPFMGAAVAGALAMPAGMALAVFLAMGLGLAAPYLLLAAVPAAARALPRPGAWMEVLRGALAFPMYAASAWLVWVLSQQAGPAGVLAVSAGSVLLGLAAWALGLAQRAHTGWGRAAGRGAAATAGLAAAAVLAGLVASDTGAPVAVATRAADTTAAGEQGAERFTAARLAALRAEGRPVFVNMTAAWCVTCLVNERVALRTEAVRRAFAERGVAYLKGDWTRGDPEVTAFLREHERDGVPLYVFYAPAGAQGRVLPQILTEGTVLEEVRGLGG